MGMFRIYRSESMALVISGVGKSLSAAATGYLCGSSDGWRNAPWINVGVAGHRDVDVGELIVANKIVDQSTAHSWYPPQLVCPATGGSLLCRINCTTAYLLHRESHIAPSRFPLQPGR